MPGRVITLEKLLLLRRRWRQRGKRVAFTNGCFDLLHRGHIYTLRYAKSLADVLVVGLNGDNSVRHLKGPGRPILPTQERAEILAALAMVDYVVLFDEPTAVALVAALEPDVYVKGGDYAEGSEAKPLPEAEVINRYGGQVVLAPLAPDSSTTNIIETVLERYGAPSQAH